MISIDVLSVGEYSVSKLAPKRLKSTARLVPYIWQSVLVPVVDEFFCYTCLVRSFFLIET